LQEFFFSEVVFFDVPANGMLEFLDFRRRKFAFDELVVLI
jgi:hypothetical protein